MLKTGKWWKLPLAGLVLVIGAVVLFDTGAGSAKTCEELVPHIIDLSKKNTNPLAAKLLKLYDIQTRDPSGDRVLRCVAKAKMNRGDIDRMVSFYIQEDSDGDRFYGFKIQ